MQRFYYLFLSLLALASAKRPNPVAWNVSISPEFIHGIMKKAQLFQPATDFEDDSNADWDEGLPNAVSSALKEYWVNEYDWFKLQDEINANYSHYALSVQAGDGYDRPVPLHFVHERSNYTDAIPLLLIHGYPSTFLEWSKVIKHLSSPTNPKDEHFHVVAVDLPGYGLSPAPVLSTLGPKQLAIAFNNLMHTLGYSKYGVISTDQGWWSGMWMSYLVPESLIGHYSDFAALQPNTTDLERYARNETTQEENLHLAASEAWTSRHTSYSALFVQSPRAIGEALADTPVGFSAYLLYLLRKINGGYEISFDYIINHTIMMLLPEAWSGMRSYKLTFSEDSNTFGYTTVPTGLSRWSWAGGPYPELDNFPMVPRTWLERHVNLTHLSTFDYGGHFPAETRPETWLRDVQQFFGSL
ncbi:Alpha/Beta hydrolase protein [Macrophomina phaseolina]|uniref:Alpha/Beta hydrolase protein n=1 Tax=Macrophomina phaseolina TaxID=35725 RepID=A0ABQ8GD77_9PEZI|nr:Alpha/Beta hydrolase protein [Macrophomina phaseolina]